MLYLYMLHMYIYVYKYVVTISHYLKFIKNKVYNKNDFQVYNEIIFGLNLLLSK